LFFNEFDYIVFRVLRLVGDDLPEVVALLEQSEWNRRQVAVLLRPLADDLRREYELQQLTASIVGVNASKMFFIHSAVFRRSTSKTVSTPIVPQRGRNRALLAVLHISAKDFAFIEKLAFNAAQSTSAGFLTRFNLTLFAYCLPTFVRPGFFVHISMKRLTGITTQAFGRRFQQHERVCASVTGLIPRLPFALRGTQLA
jgi:hypothetical protein